jgi:hypothetical protein
MDCQGGKTLGRANLNHGLAQVRIPGGGGKQKKLDFLTQTF